MDMLWPGFLVLLGIIPLLLAAYLWAMRRRRRIAVRYSSLALLREALPRQSKLRRHLPFVIFLLGLTSLVIALTRPVSSISVPTSQTTVILAIDVSHSMCSTDIPPNRLQAAEAAALSFVRNQKNNTRIGVVVFAGFAQLIQPPTDDQEALEAAIEGLSTARRTAIGSGILTSLDAIAEIDGQVAPSTTNPSAKTEINPLPEGTYVPHIIVLLTDGASNVGPEPLDAAQQAADRGVRVYTIGFGTAYGGPFRYCNFDFFEESLFGGRQNFGFGGGFRRGIDEATLLQVADLTGGSYYTATSANELERVFRNLPITIITHQETIEISVVFTAIGALLALVALVLAQLWQPVL